MQLDKSSERHDLRTSLGLHLLGCLNIDERLSCRNRPGYSSVVLQLGSAIAVRDAAFVAAGFASLIGLSTPWLELATFGSVELAVCLHSC